jgi:hypothetical protein
MIQKKYAPIVLITTHVKGSNPLATGRFSLGGGRYRIRAASDRGIAAAQKIWA